MALITLVLGDITQQQVDAVVNAANSTLMGGGGVDGAIHKRGGPAILQECRKIRSDLYPDGLPTGKAVATTAGDLPARWVIHTVGPVYSESLSPAAFLASCHAESLRIAAEVGAKTVAFPAISTGAYGYPAIEAASVALTATVQSSQGADEIRFVLHDKSMLEVFRTAAQDLGIEHGVEGL